MIGATGWLPNPRDPRDWSASELFGAGGVPAFSNNSDLAPPIGNQGQLPTCVGWAVHGALYAAQKRSEFDPERHSILASHYWSRASHGSATQLSGTWVRSYMAAMNRFGFARDSAWPYNDRVTLGPWKRNPPWQVYMAAADQRKPLEYRRIFESGAAKVDAVKRALFARSMVVFGTDLDATFYEVRADHLPLPPPRGQSIGGHAMYIVAHNNDVFYVNNSWGTGWGDGGSFQMSADWIADPTVRDVTVIDFAGGFSR